MHIFANDELLEFPASMNRYLNRFECINNTPRGCFHPLFPPLAVAAWKSRGIKCNLTLLQTMVAHLACILFSTSAPGAWAHNLLNNCSFFMCFVLFRFHVRRFLKLWCAHCAYVIVQFRRKCNVMYLKSELYMNCDIMFYDFYYFDAVSFNEYQIFTSIKYERTWRSSDSTK